MTRTPFCPRLAREKITEKTTHGEANERMLRYRQQADYETTHWTKCSFRSSNRKLMPVVLGASAQAGFQHNGCNKLWLKLQHKLGMVTFILCAFPISTSWTSTERKGQYNPLSDCSYLMETCLLCGWPLLSFQFSGSLPVRWKRAVTISDNKGDDVMCACFLFFITAGSLRWEWPTDFIRVFCRRTPDPSKFIHTRPIKCVCPVCQK